LDVVEARHTTQSRLGRIAESATKQILRETGNSMRRLVHPVDRLRELKELNGDSELDDLIMVAANSLHAFAH